MKASSIVLIIFCAGLINCCSPAEELDLQDLGYFEIIQGKWYPSETISRGVSQPYRGHEECGKDFLEFSRDSSIRFVNILDCLETEGNSGNYGINGFLLTIKYNQKEKAFLKIAHLDSGSMDLIFTDHLDGDGVEEEIRRYSRE